MSSRYAAGDDDYERYLEGTGQPRSVVVRAVDAASAAAHAGLMPTASSLRTMRCQFISAGYTNTCWAVPPSTCISSYAKAAYVGRFRGAPPPPQ